MKNKKITARQLALTGMLIALYIVLYEFATVHTWNIKIGFDFIALVTAGILLGPVYGGIVGAAGDVIATLLFPVGPYFPGFTITSFLTGLLFGAVLRKKVTVPRLLLAVGINQFVIGLLLNSYWISLLYGSPYLGLLATRIFQSVVLFVIQSVTIFVMDKALLKRVKWIFADVSADSIPTEQMAADSKIKAR